MTKQNVDLFLLVIFMNDSDNEHYDSSELALSQLHQTNLVSQNINVTDKVSF